jgi:hypothetical protein
LSRTQGIETNGFGLSSRAGFRCAELSTYNKLTKEILNYKIYH